MSKLSVYVINLDRSPERLKYIERQFKNSKLEFKRIPAIDGAKIPENQLHKYRNESKYSLDHYATLSKGEIGCALSQREAWNMGSDFNYRAAVILEDDVKISNDFESIVRTLYEEMDENVVIDLKGKKGFFELERVQSLNGITLIHYSTPPLGTQGAIFGSKAAKNLLQKVSGFSAPIDNLMQQVYKHGVEIWSLEVGCISHETEASGGASIVRSRNITRKILNELARPFWRAKVRIRNLVYHKL